MNDWTRAAAIFLTLSTIVVADDPEPRTELGKRKLLNDIGSFVNAKSIESLAGGRVRIVLDFTPNGEGPVGGVSPIAWSLSGEDRADLWGGGITFFGSGEALLNCWFLDDVEAEIAYQDRAQRGPSVVSLIFQTDGEKPKTLTCTVGTRCSTGRRQSRGKLVGWLTEPRFRMIVRDGRILGQRQQISDTDDREYRTEIEMKYGRSSFKSGRVGFSWTSIENRSLVSHVAITGKLDVERMGRFMKTVEETLSNRLTDAQEKFLAENIDQLTQVGAPTYNAANGRIVIDYTAVSGMRREVDASATPTRNIKWNKKRLGGLLLDASDNGTIAFPIPYQDAVRVSASLRIGGLRAKASPKLQWLLQLNRRSRSVYGTRFLDLEQKRRGRTERRPYTELDKKEMLTALLRDGASEWVIELVRDPAPRSGDESVGVHVSCDRMEHSASFEKPLPGGLVALSWSDLGFSLNKVRIEGVVDKRAALELVKKQMRKRK